MGLKHVLDIAAYDHIVFLIALLIPYTFKDWKRVFLLVSLFTLGHTFALVLSVFGIVSVSVTVVEFLIPITILITALYHLFTAGKSAKKETVSFVAIVTVCFGLIHGLGFSNYFNTIMVGSGMTKLVPLLAENKSSSSSVPLERNEFEVFNSILNCESGMPNSNKIEEILKTKTGIASLLFWEILLEMAVSSVVFRLKYSFN